MLVEVDTHNFIIIIVTYCCYFIYPSADTQMFIFLAYYYALYYELMQMQKLSRDIQLHISDTIQC